VVVLALVASPVLAAGIVDAVAVQPAATLLLPYFEVDLGPVGGAPSGSSCPPGSVCAPGGGGGGGPAPLGINTIFTLNNASATSVLAHVTVWSDLSVPVLSFSVYLTGYDMQVMDMRQILTAHLPVTASVGQDPQDTISPQGPLSQDINFASCTGILPYPPDAETVDPGLRAHLRASLTGQGSAFFGGKCSGRSFGDNIARGYVTVDTNNACHLFFPSDGPFYAPFLTFQNTLWGDYAFANGQTGALSGGPLVHIVADPTAFAAGDYTFYGRYHGWNAQDGRQPLATTFAARYGSESPFTGTHLVVWRDSKVNQGSFNCPAALGVRPAWYPLGQEQIVIFDEQEQPFETPVSPISPSAPPQALIPFPAEAQVVGVGSAALPSPFAEGWIWLNLNQSSAVAGPNPPSDPLASQAWVISIHNTSGTLGGVAVPGIQIDNANDRNFQIIPIF
jgi:hypothetical protein